jgi:hypothetical protein
MSEENKYRQLAMFSTIVAEVVITPTALGFGAYWLTRGMSLQLVFTSVAALLGLVVAFYRISLLRKRFESNDS